MKISRLTILALSNLFLICFTLLISSCKQGINNSSQTHTTRSLMPQMPTAEPIQSMVVSNTAIAETLPPTIQSQGTPEDEEKNNTSQDLSLSKISKKEALSHTSNTQESGELDFEVENKTGKSMFLTCFVYQRKRDFGNWRWDKSPVYEVAPNQKITIDIDTIPNEQDRINVYGYLGVFIDKQSAVDAVYELTEDQHLLDLDLLWQLKGKKVTISVEKYGSRGEFFEYDFIKKKEKATDTVPELDFVVENKTGKPILVTGFIYEKKAKGRWIAAEEEKDDMAVWRFDKTQIVRIEPNQIGIIDVDTILGNRDRNYVRGYLGVFDVEEQELAEKSTYELLDTQHKLILGEIFRLKNKKVIIDVEKYGIEEDFFDYVIKPSKSIDFAKLNTK